MNRGRDSTNRGTNQAMNRNMNRGTNEVMNRNMNRGTNEVMNRNMDGGTNEVINRNMNRDMNGDMNRNMNRNSNRKTNRNLKNVMKSMIAMAALAIGLAGCTTSKGGQNANSSDKKQLKIVTTIFPEYDWTKQILGENSDADVKMILDNGVDLHSFQPTVDDIMNIASCDMFIYVGGESDGWVKDALKQSTNKDMIVINLLETLGESVKEEEIVEGMQEDHDHDHGDGDHEDGDHEDADHKDADHEDADHEDGDHEDADHDHDHEEGEIEYDEHVWLSLKNAEILTDVIADSLGKLDSANKDTYRANADAYKEKLASLDADYQKVVDEASVKTILFGDRFPFRYLTDDYNLNYYAAFVGCSAESEASFETVIFLAGKVDELHLPAIMTIETGDQKIAKTIRDNTATKDQAILTLDSMQSTTKEDVKNGATYLGKCEANLEVLKEALK